MNMSSLRCNQRHEYMKEEIRNGRICVAIGLVWFWVSTPYLFLRFQGIMGDHESITPLRTLFLSLYAKSSTLISPIMISLFHTKYRAVHLLTLVTPSNTNSNSFVIFFFFFFSFFYFLCWYLRPSRNTCRGSSRGLSSRKIKRTAIWPLGPLDPPAVNRLKLWNDDDRTHSSNDQDFKKLKHL